MLGAVRLRGKTHGTQQFFVLHYTFILQFETVVFKNCWVPCVFPAPSGALPKLLQKKSGPERMRELGSFAESAFFPSCLSRNRFLFKNSDVNDQF